VKYVVCIPDGCADEPVPALDGRTPLEVAHMPTLARLAARGTVGRAQVIPEGLPPGSDVGNMSILGYDPALYHNGRASIEAAAMGLRLAPGEVAYRCNLVTVSGDGTMVDFAGGHPSSAAAAEVVGALQAALGGEVASPTPACSTATSWWLPPTGPRPIAPRPMTSPAGRRCCPPARRPPGCGR